MVLESLSDPLNAEKKPARMVIYGIVYTSLAIILSMWIFKEHASLVMVFLTSLVCVPLIYNTIKFEEQKDESMMDEKVLIKEHMKALKFFVYMFFGFVIAFSLWYAFLPSASSASLFSIQTQTIIDINGQMTANATVQVSNFFRIFFNNMKVLFFCILFAFIFGFGAIFILVWNASVIGAAIGNFLRAEISQITTGAGLVTVGNYFATFSMGYARYALHGIPEILAYFTAGLGASIISVALMRHSLNPEKFRRVALDSLDLVLLSVILILIAAFVEVFITPVLFSF